MRIFPNIHFLKKEVSHLPIVKVVTVLLDLLAKSQMQDLS